MKISSKKGIILIFVGGFVVIFFSIFLGGGILYEDSSPGAEETTEFKPGTTEILEEKPKAAVIDQLYNKNPNQNFQNNTIRYLEDAGYDVDYFTTEYITVNFYKNLPLMDYKFIVMRTHGLAAGTVEQSASLFTGELYSEDKYWNEQIAGQVTRGVPFLPEQVKKMGGLEVLRNQTYFTVGSRVVSELMIGDFQDTVFFICGCDTLSNPDLAEAFLDRGASSVIGWDGLVTSNMNDKIMLTVLQDVLEKQVELQPAVEKAAQSLDENDPILKIVSRVD